MKELKQIIGLMCSAAALTVCAVLPVRAELFVNSGATLTVTNGAVLDTTGSVKIFGTIDASGATPGEIKLTGDWNMASSGTFTAGTSSVTFYDAGASSITGNTTFYVFNNNTVGKTFLFQSNSTQTIQNALNLSGSVGSEVSLLGAANGQKWSLSILNGNRTLGYVKVRDGNAFGGTITANTSLNLGNNNAGWIIIAPPCIRAIC